MTLSSSHSTSAGAQLASIPELVGAIFINLTIIDLVRVQQVCRRWRDCVRNVSGLQPALYKRAISITPGDNPHFEDADVHTYSNVLYTESETLSQHLNAIGSQLSREVLELIMPNQIDCKRKLDSDAPESEVLHNYRSSQELLQYRFSWQPGNTDQQRETWPENATSAFCKNCKVIHSKFRWQNLHSLLRILEHTPYVCVDGDGPNISLHHVSQLSETADLRTWFKLFQKSMDVCEYVHHLFRIAKRSKLHNDSLIQPLCSLLQTEYLERTPDSRQHWSRRIQHTSVRNCYVRIACEAYTNFVHQS
jgi:hypothetical protein